MQGPINIWKKKTEGQSTYKKQVFAGTAEKEQKEENDPPEEHDIQRTFFSHFLSSLA